MFESETDTEVIAKLAKHVHDTYAHDGTFREIVEIVIQQLVSRKPVYKISIITKKGLFCKELL